jgi:hypothetical protein
VADEPLSNCTICGHRMEYHVGPHPPDEFPHLCTVHACICPDREEDD